MKAKQNILTGLALLLLAAAGWTQTFSDLTDISGTRNNLFSTNLAWGDYDGDGDQDLYVTNWGTAVSEPANRLYRTEGDGTFVDVASAQGVDNKLNSVDAAWADYDSDGDLDLYVADFFKQDFLYQNNGDSFSEVGRGAAAINLESRGNVAAMAWGDYNGDGHLDIYLGKWYFNNEIYQNNGDGTFSSVEDLDLGDKRDTDGVNWVDYDNDGDQDLYLINREQENGLYRNDLDSLNNLDRFPEIACALSIGNKEIGQEGAWADYDNDGDLDLYLANVGGNALYRNDGGDVFVDVAQAAGVRASGDGWITADVAWVDYDGDGDQDMYLANGSDKQHQSDVLYRNDDGTTFTNATVDAGLSASRTRHLAAGWADYSGEGAPDLYITDAWNAINILYQNNTSGSNFIRVQIQGKGAATGGSNTSGIGAQVRLVDASTGQLVAYQQVMAGGGPLIFGAPGGPYNIEVFFLGNAIAFIESTVNGGDSRTIVEP